MFLLLNVLNTVMFPLRMKLFQSKNTKIPTVVVMYSTSNLNTRIM